MPDVRSEAMAFEMFFVHEIIGVPLFSASEAVAILLLVDMNTRYSKSAEGVSLSVDAVQVNSKLEFVIAPAVIMPLFPGRGEFSFGTNVNSAIDSNFNALLKSSLHEKLHKAIPTMRKTMVNKFLCNFLLYIFMPHYH